MIGNLGEDGRVHDMRGVGEQEGVAVGCAPRRLTGADVSAGTADILDVELPAEMLGQLLGSEPREHVGQAAGREWDDDSHRPCWISLRPRDARQRGSTRCQMDKLSTGKFHRGSPHSITSSARASTVVGMSILSDFAVLRLTTMWNFVGSVTGRSAGFSPLTIRPT